MQLKEMFYAFGFVCALGVAFVWAMVTMSTTNSVRSHRPIVPTIEPVIRNGHLDSIYVYTEPKQGLLHRIFK